MRNFAQSTAKAEHAAEDALSRKHAETMAAEVIELARRTLSARGFHHFKKALFPLIADRPRPKGVKWTPKEQAKADGDRMFANLNGGVNE